MSKKRARKTKTSKKRAIQKSIIPEMHVLSFFVQSAWLVPHFGHFKNVHFRKSEKSFAKFIKKQLW